ncbi:MAG: hypothetical protein KJ921_12560, partial [Proteobacteria bacterium]|nr:hypothetical protein [Pseudomonadota bacterium]
MKRKPPAWWPGGCVEEGVVAGCEEGCRLPPYKARPLPTWAAAIKITFIVFIISQLAVGLLERRLWETALKPTCGYKKPVISYKLVGKLFAPYETAFKKVFTK